MLPAGRRRHGLLHLPYLEARSEFYPVRHESRLSIDRPENRMRRKESSNPGAVAKPMPVRHIGARFEVPAKLTKVHGWHPIFNPVITSFHPLLRWELLSCFGARYECRDSAYCAHDKDGGLEQEKSREIRCYAEIRLTLIEAWNVAQALFAQM